MTEIEKLKETIRSYESEQDRLKENITAWKLKCEQLTTALEQAYARAVDDEQVSHAGLLVSVRRQRRRRRWR